MFLPDLGLMSRVNTKEHNAMDDQRQQNASDQTLRPGDRVKGYGGRVPPRTFPCNMGTVVGTANPTRRLGGVAVRWDTGQVVEHEPHELKHL
jgi:hypothetical protein